MKAVAAPPVGRHVPRPAATSRSPASGKVGYALVRQLVEERCPGHRGRRRPRPPSSGPCRDFGVEAVASEKIHAVECDVYAPCALGGALSARRSPSCAAPPCAAPPTTSWPSRAATSGWPRPASSMPPTTCVNAGGVINIAEELARRLPPRTGRDRPCAASSTPPCGPRHGRRPRASPPPPPPTGWPSAASPPSAASTSSVRPAEGGAARRTRCHTPRRADRPGGSAPPRPAHRPRAVGRRPRRHVPHDPAGPPARPEDLGPQPDGQGAVRRVAPGPRGRPGRLGLGAAGGPRRRVLPYYRDTRRDAHPRHDARRDPARRCSPGPTTPTPAAGRCPTTGGRADLGSSPARSPIATHLPHAAGHRPGRPACGATTRSSSATSATARPPRATSTRRCNFAGIHRLPLVFVCENNGYAISVPLAKESAVENIAQHAHSVRACRA